MSILAEVCPGWIAQVGRPSDVWSLGCILYQMVYGHTPFSSLAFIQKMHAITDPAHRVAMPTLRNTALSDVIRRCLDRNPRTRISMQVSCYVLSKSLHTFAHVPLVLPLKFRSSSSEQCCG